MSSSRPKDKRKKANQDREDQSDYSEWSPWELDEAGDFEYSGRQMPNGRWEYHHRAPVPPNSSTGSGLPGFEKSSTNTRSDENDRYSEQEDDAEYYSEDFDNVGALKAQYPPEPIDMTVPQRATSIGPKKISSYDAEKNQKAEPQGSDSTKTSSSRHKSTSSKSSNKTGKKSHKRQPSSNSHSHKDESTRSRRRDSLQQERYMDDPLQAPSSPQTAPGVQPQEYGNYEYSNPVQGTSLPVQPWKNHPGLDHHDDTYDSAKGPEVGEDQNRPRYPFDDTGS